jgi:hypothetical protein
VAASSAATAAAKLQTMSLAIAKWSTTVLMPNSEPGATAYSPAAIAAIVVMVEVTGRVAAAFLGGYGLMRFIAEYFREPDAHLGVLALGMTMGQWLCVPMVLGGIALWHRAGRLQG